jgi:catechol 2,3-dioxygenase-like lactoylglutathione lyase family enzyme
MHKSIARVALLVEDYDRAIAYYQDKLGFTLLEDTQLPEQDKRWVVMAPPGGKGAELVLAYAQKVIEKAAVGNQAGGRVFLFLQTDDFERDYQAMKDKGVRFMEQPREEPYGTVVVFADLYGNLWDLIQMK